MIPKIIHRVVPRNTTPIMEKCWESVIQNTKDYEHYTHYDDGDYEIVGDLLPLCEKGAFKADLIRLEVLYKYGGIYLDSDVELYKSIDNLLDTDLFVCREDDKYIVNTIIGSSFNNNNILELISKSRKLIEENRLVYPYLFKYQESDEVQMAFGPFVLHEYLSSVNSVTVLESSSFGMFFHKDSKEAKYGKHLYAGSWVNNV